jgi:transcriptional regulator with XRE-family HTH domain
MDRPARGVKHVYHWLHHRRFVKTACGGFKVEPNSSTSTDPHYEYGLHHRVVPCDVRKGDSPKSHEYMLSPHDAGCQSMASLSLLRLHGREMEYLVALGQTLREIRVAVGLRREDCSRALSREYLASVERGRQSISIVKFRCLCECLGITPSLVLFTVEARLAAVSLEEYQANQERQLMDFTKAGKLSSEVDTTARQGVRGKRAEITRKAVQALQLEGITKTDIARKLGVGSTTVDRHWNKTKKNH